ncbi:hypothetical protein PC118_g24014 [Phytophthora cactorum]|uniref:Uncharacterized protein n=1 Tax=Phytophthora cactorum TaxID=29920 RepID=A0A8T1EYG2_9STRA|nr:hypothetical protein PC118_g24014 [Phytophthora cactorum]
MISALSISGVPPTQDTRRHVKRQDVASLSLGVVEDARRTRMSEETPTSTRIWAQTECWRISSSPPASVCMVVALWTVGDVKPRMLHALVVEVHASGECQRALQHLEKDVINEGNS